MKIFQTYTGNAMLNNALMTIEALAKISSVTEISTTLLKELYQKVSLKDINKRLKSYTMAFSLNNPLVNPAKKTNNAGENTYHHLLNAIIDGFENDGEKVCEISGLKFNKTFEDFYKEEIERQKKELVSRIKDNKLLNKELKNIENTDTSLNRSWFPLIGGLGSDAQALPQAKFTVQIHPICIPILQFLPLSAVLYKGGIFLIDSSNFELARYMVAYNTKILSEKIQEKSSKDSVENVRDFSKGDYLLKALELLAEKEDNEECYTDLNLWSFSNSGTGASCEIDRVPNSLIRKLQKIKQNPQISNELKRILSKNESAYSFIEALEGNKDWFLLYPSVFGSGKKRVEYEGTSPEFLEAYYKEIGFTKLLPIAKYIAGLIDTYKSKTFENILDKTDAWNNPEYRIELFKVLVKATEISKWTLKNHIGILDNQDVLPIKNNFYQLHKLIHYFTQKRIVSNKLPQIAVDDSKVYQACQWIISLIQTDTRYNNLRSSLISPNENPKVGFNRLIFDALDYTEFLLEEVIDLLYDEYFILRKHGINELMRIFFSQPEQDKFVFVNRITNLEKDRAFQSWKANIQAFVTDYQSYFYAKNFNFETNIPSYKKFVNTINALIKEEDNFYSLLFEMIYNTNEYIREVEKNKNDKWVIDDLMTNPAGGSNINICLLAIKFLSKQTAIKSSKENNYQLLNS